jgi:hypothetical protein
VMRYYPPVEPEFKDHLVGTIGRTAIAVGV